MMKRLTVAVMLLGLLWSGYWWRERGRAEAAAEAFLAGSTAVSASAVEIHGFPNRIDLTLTDPVAEAGGLRWSGPMMQVLRLVYAEDHLIFALPELQELETDRGTWRIGAPALRASLVRGETPAPGRIVAEAARLGLTPPDGTGLVMEAPRAAVTPRAANEADFAVATGPVTAADGEILLDALRLSGRAGLPVPDRIEIEDGLVVLHGVGFDVTGQLQADGSGRLSGALTLTREAASLPTAPLPEAFDADRVTVEVADGMLRIGGTPLFPLPPLP